MIGYVSRDGKWTVRPIRLNGRTYLRVAHLGAVLPDGTIAVQWLSDRRSGPEGLGGGWYRVADCVSTSEVKRYVALADLEEELVP